MKHTAFILILIPALLFTACSDGQDGSDLAGTSWSLVSHGPVDAQIAATQGVDTSLTFGSDGKVGGNLGCNSFAGEYTQEEDEIILGPLAATLMACQEARMSQETAAFAVLNGSVHFMVDGNTLTIFSGDGNSALILTRY